MSRHKTHERKVLRLRQLRRQREMTQAQLGALCGVGYQAINGIEKGRAKPSFDVALKLEQVFGLSIAELFTYVEVPDVAGPEAVAS